MSGDESLFRDIGTDKRKEMAKKGQAMPDGQYPIATVGDLKNAIRAYGRAKDGDKPKVRRHIKKRARALGKTDLIPESWASMSNPFDDLAGEIKDLTDRMTLISSGGRYPDGSPWNPQNHPRDEKGKFRQVIAELKGDLEGEAGTGEAVEGLSEVEDAAAHGDIRGRAGRRAGRARPGRQAGRRTPRTRAPSRRCARATATWPRRSPTCRWSSATSTRSTGSPTCHRI